MAQEFENKDMKVEDEQVREDPLHDVKEQIESGVGTIGSQPLYEGAVQGEKLPETRVGETLLTDNVQKLDSTEPSAMDTDEPAPEEGVVKGDVAETFASEYKDDHDRSGDKKDESVSDDADDVKSGDGSQDLQGTKFKKLTGAGLPRGKPHFRVSANHGNRGLGDSSLQSSGGLRGSSRGGGLARTGSGLARTGSGIPQGNSDLKDFSAAFLESENKISEPSLPPSTDAKLSYDAKPDESDTAGEMKDAAADKLTEPSLPPSTDAKLSSDEKAGDATVSDTMTNTKNAAAEKFTAAKDTTAEKMSTAKEMIVEKATTAKDIVVEKAGDLKTGFVSTLKDQLLPVKDSDVSTSKMDVDKSASAK